MRGNVTAHLRIIKLVEVGLACAAGEIEKVSHKFHRGDGRHQTHNSPSSLGIPAYPRPEKGTQPEGQCRRRETRWHLGTPERRYRRIKIGEHR